jgi:hypothetical protein
MKPVVLSTSEWKRIREELHFEYPKSVFALRTKMRSVLGFTVREHREWVEHSVTDPIEWLGEKWGERTGNYVDSVHLDFYDSRKKTMFLLKYSEFIGRD